MHILEADFLHAFIRSVYGRFEVLINRGYSQDPSSRSTECSVFIFCSRVKHYSIGVLLNLFQPGNRIAL